VSPRRVATEPVPAPDAAETRQLAEVFRQEAGLAFADEGFVLERRLRERVAALGLTSFSQYVDHLRHDPGGAREIEEALELVTTHETYFFREEYQLRAFRDEVVPRLRQLAGARRRLAVWSAGCATGEEAYTVAMLLSHGGALPPGWEARVFGSDLSRRCIAAARRGVYGPAAFRCVPVEFRQQYFVEAADGTAVSPAIRAMCSFAQLNLLDRDRLAVVGRVDAIFCRNVLIYLDQEARRRVLDNVYECLLPGGFLMLGHSESLLHVPSGFEPVRLRDDLVYRKPEGAPKPRGGP
jgi:chemotaxis protein methyltransferase CheR